MRKQEELREAARRIGAMLKRKYRTKRVFLVGSAVTGRVHERSDVDIVVEGLAPRLYMKALTEAYDMLTPGMELNLIPYEDAFDSLREKALNEGELLHGYEQVA